MRLVRAHVTKFKSISDATPCNVGSTVTALVGKNESGKTAVFEAIYRGATNTGRLPAVEGDRVARDLALQQES